MNVVKTLSVYLVQMQSTWKIENFKKLKSAMKKKRFTPEQFIEFCDKEIAHILVKSRLQVKKLQQK